MLYRLKASINVQKLAPFSDRFGTGFDVIQAGEIVEAISTANQSGQLLIRHAGRCYRAWKEQLQDRRVSERLIPIKDTQLKDTPRPCATQHANE